MGPNEKRVEEYIKNRQSGRLRDGSFERSLTKEEERELI